VKQTSDSPLVSVIVPTYNSSATLEACLQSIKAQSYTNIEVVVVDNNSKDDTKAVALKFTENVHNKGPERSAQRNYAVSIAKGEYVMIIDSDMELSEDVVADCVSVLADSSIAGVIIPEESFGKGFWAQCKKLERSFYVGISWMEAARAFRKSVYEKAGGYDEKMISGEDWDLSQRVEEQGKIGRIDSFIFHNEGELKLIRTLKKKYYYAQKFASYQTNTKHSNVSMQTGPLTRYKLFFSKPGKLFANPVVGVGMLFMKTSEFSVGALGILSARVFGS
jgi:glycosyltransferase involved in cell wall biosynthesis